MSNKLKSITSFLVAMLFVILMLPANMTYAAEDYVTVTKSVNPSEITTEEEAEVTLNLKGSPPVSVVVPNDVILIIDKSGSMLPSYNHGEDKIGAAKNAAKGFIDLIDFSKHRVGIVDFSGNAREFNLTTDGEATKKYIDTINAGGGTETGLAIRKAMKLLASHRTEAHPVIILMTDGAANNKNDALVAAEEAKNAGIVFYTIALLNKSQNPDASAPNLLLKDMATTAAHHHFVLGSTGLADIYANIVKEIGVASAYDVIIKDVVAPEFEIVPGSYDDNIPKPEVNENTLIWNLKELKEQGQTFKYKIRHKDGAKIGDMPISDGSEVSYSNYKNERVNGSVPVVNVTVKYPAPVITSIVEDNGEISGGNEVTITGDKFRQGIKVYFGGVEASNVQLISSTEIKAVVPAHKLGQVKVKVVNDDKQYAQTEYDYWANPEVTKIKPNHGPLDGNTRVTIEGNYFVDKPTVKFGEKVARVVYRNPSLIYAVTPQGENPGTVDIEIINPDGKNTIIKDGFTYDGAIEKLAPVINEITPNAGEMAGGKYAYIKGENFESGITVKFGQINAPVKNYFDSTKIRVIVPKTDVAGAVDVEVTNPDGKNAVVSGGYTYKEKPSPVINEITPNAGEMAGGKYVDIKGENFESGITVKFGDVDVPVYKYYDNTKIKIKVPKVDVAGAVDVEVTNPDGKNIKVENGYTYKAPPEKPSPVINEITPNVGEMAGGKYAYIKGENFESGITVKFGQINAPVKNYFDSTKIRVIVPKTDVAGAVDVEVTNPDGKNVVVSGGYTYKEKPSPVINEITPNAGEMAGGKYVCIKGENFESEITVKFGDIDVPVYKYYDNTKIKIKVPKVNVAGAVDVEVTNPDGKNAKVENGYTYNEPVIPVPEIDNLSKNNGYVEGGYSVTIYGSNFDSDIEATVGGKNASVRYYNSTQIGVTIPKGDSEGEVDLVITNPSTGKSANTKFTYIPVPPAPSPEIAKLSKNSGVLNGGDSVIITGSNFDKDVEVTIDGKKANYCKRYNSGYIKVVIPEGDSVGEVDLVVTNASTGMSASVKFTYIPNPPPPPAPVPVITKISKDNGYVEGGYSVMLYGSNFDSDIEATVGGKSAKVSCYNSTQMKVYIPEADSEGEVDLVITNASTGKSTSTKFTYIPVPPAPAPTMTKLSRNRGLIQGGNRIYIYGTDFQPGMKVKFGENYAAVIREYGSTKVAVKVPSALNEEIVDITVINVDSKSGTMNSAYTYYIPAVEITKISKNNGYVQGGYSVMLYGSNFDSGIEATVGGKSAKVSRYNSTQMKVYIPKGDSEGEVDLVITSLSTGKSASTKFTYIPAPPPPSPEIYSINKDKGPLEGGYSVVIKGCNFNKDITVTVGGKKPSNCHRYNSGYLKFKIPEGDSVGEVDIVITNASTGMSNSIKFTYN